MSRLICCIAALMVSASGLYAQGFMGTWQGILKVPQAPNDERIVIKIASDKEDRLTAQFYSIDQNPTPLKAESVKTSGQGIKINIPTINGRMVKKVVLAAKIRKTSWRSCPLLIEAADNT